MTQKSLGDLVRQSIAAECTAMKLGNVHPAASFDDMSYETFLQASAAIGKAVDVHSSRWQLKMDNGGPAKPTSNSSKGNVRETNAHGVGPLVFECVSAMMESVNCNTSLGTILLLGPLVYAALILRSPLPPACTTERISPLEIASERAHSADAFSASLGCVLAELNPLDSFWVYEAIRICQPGGMGKSQEMDISQKPPENLLDAMQFAACRDDVALQYVSNYSLCFRLASRYRALRVRESESVHSPFDTVQLLQLELLTERPDSLIVRKGGIELANKVQSQSALVNKLVRTDANQAKELWTDLDRWMRRQRSNSGKQLANPGTHADLIAATLFLESLLGAVR